MWFHLTDKQELHNESWQFCTSTGCSLLLVWSEYNKFGRKPYWAEIEQSQRDRFDTEQYRLSRLSDLKAQPVADDSSKVIGTIDNFAVDRKSGRIAYAAVKLNGDKSGKRYPMPLGSFVVPSMDQSWKVELSSDVIKNIWRRQASQRFASRPQRHLPVSSLPSAMGECESGT